MSVFPNTILLKVLVSPIRWSNCLRHLDGNIYAIEAKEIAHVAISDVTFVFSVSDGRLSIMKLFLVFSELSTRSVVTSEI